MASTYDKVKRWGKRTIGFPNGAPPVVSISHWVRGLSQDPKRDVRCFLRPFFSMAHIPAGASLFRVALPHLYMDITVQ